MWPGHQAVCPRNSAFCGSNLSRHQSYILNRLLPQAWEGSLVIMHLVTGLPLPNYGFVSFILSFAGVTDLAWVSLDVFATVSEFAMMPGPMTMAGRERLGLHIAEGHQELG